MTADGAYGCHPNFIKAILAGIIREALSFTQLLKSLLHLLSLLNLFKFFIHSACCEMEASAPASFLFMKQRPDARSNSLLVDCSLKTKGAWPYAPFPLLWRPSTPTQTGKLLPDLQEPKGSQVSFSVEPCQILIVLVSSGFSLSIHFFRLQKQFHRHLLSCKFIHPHWISWARSASYFSV